MKGEGIKEGEDVEVAHRPVTMPPIIIGGLLSVVHGREVPLIGPLP